MFDLGWQEFLMAAVVLVLVVGPKDMPRIMQFFASYAESQIHGARIYDLP